jgi:archaellum component FlaC
MGILNDQKLELTILNNHVNELDAKLSKIILEMCRIDDLLKNNVKDLEDTVDKLSKKISNQDDAIKKIENSLNAVGDDVRKAKNEVHSNHMDLGKVRDEVHSSNVALGKVREEVHSSHLALGNVRDEVHSSHLALGNVRDGVHSTYSNLVEAKRSCEESVWSHVFHDSIKDSGWLVNQRFSPGRWAVGYQYLYVLYRALNGVKVNSILETGLGQSTRMITQYVEANPDCSHRVVEHDKEWIEFFKEENKLSSRSEVVQCNLYTSQYEDDEKVLMYAEFDKRLSDRKYDCISIDAPFGGDANKYARVDFLKLVPNCLADSFVILVDDVNRPGEQNMVELLQRKLEQNHIQFCTGKYQGNKTTFVITSLDRKFLCSL